MFDRVPPTGALLSQIAVVPGVWKTSTPSTERQSNVLSGMLSRVPGALDDAARFADSAPARLATAALTQAPAVPADRPALNVPVRLGQA